MPPDQPTYITSTRATAIPALANETDIFKVRHSIIVLIFPLISVTIVGLALFIVVNQSVFPSNLINPVRIGLLVAVGFIDLLIFLEWLTSIYTLTNRRVQSRFGIVGENSKTIALGPITDTRVEIGILGRLFNYGNVVIEAANINGLIIFHNITSPSSRKDQIDQAKLDIAV